MSQKTKGVLAELATLSALFGITMGVTFFNVIHYLP